MKMQTKNLCACVLLSGSGLCVIFVWPVVIDCMLSLRCNPLLYHLWKNIPFEIESKFYFFNWTNPEDFYNVSIKPRFEQVGPYVFLQTEEKSNVVWNDNGTVTFEMRRFWRPKHDTTSNLSLQDKITNIDYTLLGISYVTRSWNYYIRRGAFMTLSGYFSTIHQTHTVSELLFEGYPQPLIGVAKAIPIFNSLKLPAWNRFGWMYTRNGTTDFDGVFNMGIGSKSDLGRIYKWNYENVTGYYDGSCNEVSGFFGQLFSNNITHAPLEIFSSDMRRTVALQFEKEESVAGISGYKYISGNYMLDNGTVNPSNKCFCPGECTPSGLINISESRHNAPIFVSMPNFYGADPYYLDLIDGLKPEKEEHECVFIIEPTSGMVIGAKARLQLNFFMQPVSGTNYFDNAPRVFFPIIWIGQDFTVAGREAFLLKTFLAIPTTSITLGVTLILSGAILLLYKIYNHENENFNPNLPRDEVEGNVLLVDDKQKETEKCVKQIFVDDSNCKLPNSQRLM